MKNLINNQNGHGMVPSKKEALKLVGILLTFPVSIPLLILKEKIKEKKDKKKK